MKEETKIIKELDECLKAVYIARFGCVVDDTRTIATMLAKMGVRKVTPKEIEK